MKTKNHMPINFLKKNPDPRMTRTKTTRTQIHEHKPRTQTQTQQKISRQPNTKKKTHTQKSARKHIPKNQQEYAI